MAELNVIAQRVAQAYPEAERGRGFRFEQAGSVDDPIGNSWGYIEGLRLASAGSIIAKLIDTVSKGGFYLFNISPMADGTIPRDQQEVLLNIGAWLEINGEAIYGTRP